MSYVCRLAVMLALALVLLAAGPAAGSEPATAPFDAVSPLALASDGARARAAYRRARWSWSTRRIPYYNAAKGNAWAVRTAVRAWNRSGVRVRFVAVRRSRARLVIRNFGRRCEAAGFAPVVWNRRTRRVVRAEVLLSRSVPSDFACTRWSQATVAAHELGHVLGLAHEQRRCATMNTFQQNLSPELCSPRMLELWRWRCRILESDDVRGAVRIYGGRVKPRPASVCDLVAPPSTPQRLVLTAIGHGGVGVRFRRPADRRQPPHLQRLTLPGYRTAIRQGSCPAAPDRDTHAGWSVPAGSTQTTGLQGETGGRHCVAVWAVDQSERLSKPATASIDLAPLDEF